MFWGGVGSAYSQSLEDSVSSFACHLSLCFHYLSLFPCFSVQFLEKEKAVGQGNHSHPI